MDQFNFDSGLDDLQVETSSSVFGKIVLGAMLVAFAAASMATTFSFFAVYAPALGAVIHPDYAPVVAGALGVLLFDLAGLGWTVLRSRNSDTSRQFVIASIAAVVTIALALLTSALYVLLSSSFDVGLYRPDGELAEFGRMMQVVGVVTMTLGFVLNFGFIAAYVNTSAGVSKAVQDTQLRAYVTGSRFAADKARAQLVTRRTLAEIMRRLPSLADLQGRANSHGYLDQTFTAPGRADSAGELPAGDEDEAAQIRAEIERLQEMLARQEQNRRSNNKREDSQVQRSRGNQQGPFLGL